MRGTSEHLVNSIRQYYVTSEKSYQGWGKDSEREGVYALHCGFHPKGIPIDQHESTKKMTLEIIARADIKKDERVLDAGCGSGAILFELAETNQNAKVYGINIATNQLNGAADYAKSRGLSNVALSMQDYSRTAFTSSFFDKVIFSESLAHSEDKTVLLDETRRVLKNGGRLVIADAFLIHRKLSSDNVKLLEQAENGWVLPPLLTIQQIVETLNLSGFSEVVVEDVTTNILPSTSRMAKNAIARLDKYPIDQNDQLTMSRYACMAADQLMRNGTLGYFFLTANA